MEKKNRTFLYESNDYWAQNGDIIIGSDYADVDVYGIRIYETGLGSNAVHKNYINWLPGTDEKVEESENNNLYDAMKYTVRLRCHKGKNECLCIR